MSKSYTAINPIALLIFVSGHVFVESEKCCERAKYTHYK